MDKTPQWIARQIEREGPLTFARYMALALYHPEFGYYAQGVQRVGRGGDYLTAVSMGPAFGRVLAEVFFEIWQHLGCPSPFYVVEQGAGDGRLFGDVVAALPAALREAARFRIVEPLPRLREIQSARLKGAGVEWTDSSEDLGAGICGVHFSNELVDAMPFHLLISRGGAWKELYVGAGSEGLEWREGPPSDAVLGELDGLESLPEGWIVEVRPRAASWLQDWAARLADGAILIFDYGAPCSLAQRLRSPRGSFRCYERHGMDEQPLERPGHKDITADVDFSALARVGLEAGHEVLGPEEFGRFLIRSCAELLRGMDGKPEEGFLRNFQSLVRPESFGARFQAFGLALGRLRGCRLRGFARMGS